MLPLNGNFLEGSLMYRTVYLAIILIFTSPIFASNSVAHTSLNPMLKKAMPAIVNIRSQHDSKPNTNAQTPNEHKGMMVELGSGVIIDSEHGLIVTNAHVIHGASAILITLNNDRKYVANVIGEDIDSDLAVLHISAKNLTEIAIGKSHTLEVGDFVTAIGNPFGLHQTVTSGIVSGLHRNTNSSLNNFIQTDAPINPGNSGGALINMNAELVGINTSILSTGNAGNIGIGFAIPSDMVMHIANQLITHHNVKRGLLGVTLQELTPQLASAMHTFSEHGAIVNSVSPDSAAAKAGIQEKDVIISVDDQDIYTADEARSYIGVLREGTDISVSIERNGSTQVLHTKLGSINDHHDNAHHNRLSGMSLIDYDEVVADSKRIKGAMITKVTTGSEVWLAGLSQGDVIVAVNDHLVSGLDAFMQQTDSLGKSKNDILIEVKRGLYSYFLVVE